jgi:hypothetical protein
VGMAFLVSKDGFFITAKHVLTLRGKIKNPKLFGVLFLKNKEPLILTVRNILLHDKADIALGLLDNISNQNSRNHIEPEDFHLCMVIPDEGEDVSTFAYSKDTNFLYNIYDLKINNEIKWAYGIVRKYYPNGRDSYLLPGPCVETSMTLEAGLSGGPVINKNGQIIGVNSTSFTGQEKDISYFTPINPIANISFETESEGKKTKTTLLDLVN